MAHFSMAMERQRSLVIIGGGFAGAATALNIIENSADPLDLTIVEPAARLGRGIAYATGDPDHVVNGIAGSFVLDPARPEHFLAWLTRKIEAGAWKAPEGIPLALSSPPRALYGEYLEQRLEEAIRNAAGRVRFAHLRDRAIDMDGPAVILASGLRLPANQTVLATGLHRRKPAFHAALDGHDGYVENIFEPSRLDGAARASHIVILGSGLTMLDAIISVEKRGFRGRYTVISRRGLLVAPRGEAPPAPRHIDAHDLPATARDVVRWAQTERRANNITGNDRDQLAALFRQYTHAIWARLDNHERGRLLRRLLPFWNLTQHRAAPASFAWLERIREQGRLRSLAGTVTRLQPAGHGVRAGIKRRGQTEVSSLDADLAISALGYEFDWTRIDDPLVRNLLARGRVAPHPVGLGIQADPTSLGVLDRDGSRSDTLFAIGHPLRGEVWESNSLREQVDQARRLGLALGRTILPTAAGSDHQPQLTSAA